MPKKKSSRQKVEYHFLWSVFFLFMTLFANIYALWIGNIIGVSSTWLWAGLIFTIVAISLVTHERRARKFGKGEFLWSIFFTTLTLAISVYLAINILIFITVIPVVTTFIALFLLFHEKHYY